MDVFDLVAKLSLDSSEYEKGLGDAETKGSTFGSGLKKAAVVGAGAVAAVGTAAIAAGTALAKGTGDVAAYGDNIDKMSQKMGISARAYQEWDAIMQHSGTSIDSMSRGMQTLQKNAINSADKFEKLGISQEQLASMSTEDLFSATITGLQTMGEGAERTALASELLGGSAKELGALLNTSAEDTQAMRDRVHELGGVMSDDAVKASAQFQDTLQDLRTGFDGLKRNMLSEFLPAITGVMDGLTNLFTGNYDEGIEQISEGVGQAIDKLSEMLPKILEVGNNALLALGNAIIQNLPTIIQTGIQVVEGFISGMAQAVPQIIETAKGAISNFAQGITTNLPTVIAKAQELITNFSNAVQNDLPQILAQGVAFVQNLVNGIVQGLPSFLDTAVQLITGFLKAVINALPQILNAGMQILTAVVNGIVESLPEIIEAAGEIITSLLDTILDNLPEIIEGGLQMLEAIVQGIMDNLPEIISAIIEVVAKIVVTIAEHLPEILQAGIDILEMLITGLINTIPDLVAAIPQIIQSIKDSFSQYDWGAIGSNIIDGIKNGISSAAGRIADAAKEAARKALDAAKDFLGIHSPSTVFRDQIGKYMALGMAEGFEDNIPVDDMQNSLDGMVNSLDSMVNRMGNMVRGDMQFSTEGVNRGATYNGGITINVYGAQGQSEQQLVDILMDEITRRTGRTKAVWA